MSRESKLWAVIAALVVLLVALQFASGRRLEARDAVLDSLRTEELAARAAQMGWESRFAESVAQGGTLARWLQESRDSTALLKTAVDSLARETELLGGRLALFASMYAEARGQIEAHDATVHTSAEGAAVDSITGHVDDGLLSADVTATVEPPTVAIPFYTVELAIALGLIDAPDGRQLVTARAEDSRVSVRFGEVYVEPAPPVQYCSWGTRIEWGAWGAAVGATAGVLSGVIG